MLERLKRHRIATVIIALVVFTFWTLPEWVATMWPVLVRDKTIPEWLAEQRWPGVSQTAYNWITLVLGATLAVLAVVVIVSSKLFNTKASQPLPRTASGNQRLRELLERGTHTLLHADLSN